ncbi:MAG: aminoglycoside phosphotransferase family protein [Chloroflexi bacterium]|nr:aminoglycoside phosphotransferase family protein [Chloroflexota bacterium]
MCADATVPKGDKAAPNLDGAALLAAIRVAYGLPAERLTFVPIGEVTEGYTVEARGGARYFAKVYGASRLARLSAERLPYTLPLACELHDKGLLPEVAYPMPTLSGALQASFGGQPLVLYPYIAGRLVTEGDFAAAEMMPRFAETVARLHNATPQLETPLPFETFDAPFRRDLLRGLRELERLGQDSRPGQRALRDLLLPRRQELLGHLAQLEALGDRACSQERALVLCHTDLAPTNLICDEAGRLHLLDWEGALLAPAEHDLVFFSGEHFAAFLADYRRCREQRVPLDPELFSFYFHRRNLEDLADWVARILWENATDEQDRHDLEGIQDDCLRWWDDLHAGPRLRAIVWEHNQE